MNRIEKREFVTSLREELGSAALVVVTHQSGLTVEESTDLRCKMRDAGASFRVVKNSLARIVVRDSDFSVIESHLKGPSALAFSKDPVVAARVAVSFIDENPKLSVVAGVLQGKLLDAQAVHALAKLPSLDQLRAKLLGLLMAPATKLATVISEPGASVARVVSSYSKK